MQVFLYLSVKNNDLNELNAINRLCEHLALNDKSLVLKASGVEFNHSYALYTYECGNYAELKERLKEAVCSYGAVRSVFKDSRSFGDGYGYDIRAD